MIFLFPRWDMLVSWEGIPFKGSTHKSRDALNFKLVFFLSSSLPNDRICKVHGPCINMTENKVVNKQNIILSIFSGDNSKTKRWTRKPPIVVSNTKQNTSKKMADAFFFQRHWLLPTNLPSCRQWIHYTLRYLLPSNSSHVILLLFGLLYLHFSR